MLRKYFSIVLSAAMVLTMMPMMAAESFAAASGSDYLNFTAVGGDVTVSMTPFNDPDPLTLEYTNNPDAKEWSEFQAGTASFKINEGDTYYLRRKGEAGPVSKTSPKLTTWTFKMTGTEGATVSASGNVMSLADKTCSLDAIPCQGCFRELFSGCAILVKAPDMPDAELTNNCFYQMFSDCTALTEAPELPYTTLKNFCYAFMFEGCTDLKKAPELPATSVPLGAYNGMFSDCKSLTEAPELPATSIGEYGYRALFSGCSSLTEISTNFSVWADDTTEGWVQNVAAEGTFYCVNDLDTSKFDADHIPDGWTVAREVSVAFDTAGGSAVETQKVFARETVTEPEAPTKKDYDFGGWFKDKDCTKAWDFANDKVYKNTTIYAKWIPIYYVVFDANGGSGEMEKQAVKIGTAEKLNANSYSKKWCIFGGWQDEDGNVYNDTSMILDLAENAGDEVVLKAQWIDTIEQTDIAGAQIAPIEPCEYTGEEIIPEITVSYDGENLEEGRDFLTVFKSNRDVGTATAVIVGQGHYKGLKEVNYDIIVPQTSINSLTGAKKAFTVKWDKKTVTGYNIQYSRYSSFKKSKKATIKSASTVSRKIKKLKRKKLYYVRVRSYVKQNGKTYYSDWSASESVKTK